MNIENIIKEDIKEVDIDKLELPESMQQQQQQNTASEEPGKPGSDEGNLDGAAPMGDTTLSLEQLAGMIIVGYNTVSCAIYKKIEPGFDASLTKDEEKALQQPLELVLKQYDVQMTPLTALIVAVAGINFFKIRALIEYRKTLHIDPNAKIRNLNTPDCEKCKLFKSENMTEGGVCKFMRVDQFNKCENFTIIK